MKPITLTICGWGPYRDEQPPIDFEALGSRGLFLITGATGAGKTTIFDAVTYALYGDLSGKTREKGSVYKNLCRACNGAWGKTVSYPEKSGIYAAKKTAVKKW